jgi:hypothetical protein
LGVSHLAGVIAQVAAAAFVIGSYYLAERIQSRKRASHAAPRRQAGEASGQV